MKRILFYSEGWGLGGIETFIMNTIRELPREQFQCDVFCTHDWSDAHDEELTSLGVHRYCVFSGHKPNQLKRLLSSSQEFRKLLRKKRYDVVHICTMNGMGFLYSQIARQEHVPTRVVHSHSSMFGEGHQMVKRVFHNLGKCLWKKSATVLIACSEDAGKYLFDNTDFILLPNGIDTRKYRFSLRQRESLRNKLSIPSNALLFGAVGRIADVKQPFFQVDLLCSLRAAGIPAYLLLVGDGPLSGEVSNYAKEKKVADFLRLPGATSDPSGDYSALDVFTMPSLFEGLPMVLIEAASSGLPCLISKNVPEIPFPLEQVHRVEGSNADFWTHEIREVERKTKLENRAEAFREVQNAGYAVSTMAQTLVDIYQH